MANRVINRIARSMNIDGRQWSGFGKQVKRTKLWYCSPISKRTFKQFKDKLMSLGYVDRVEYRGMDPKVVGQWYADTRSYNKSVYVYYK